MTAPDPMETPHKGGPQGERRLHVPILTRVEGEGGLFVRLDGQTVCDVQLSIYEPPRLFEAFLRGRSFDEVADITARICGICPVAYQMTAVHALENALGVEVTPAIDHLRHLLYCGEWIESHTLHVHLLHAPDFFGCHSGIELARRFPDEVKRGLQIKKFGNRLLEVLGGRAIHPINVAVGGFYGVPRREALQSLIPDFRWCLQAAIDTAKWVADFPFPDFEVNYQYVSLRDGAQYPIMHGRIACSDGLTIDPREYEQYFAEEQVPHSTALHSLRIADRQTYFVGPLARINMNRESLSPAARRTADEIGWKTPCWNPHRGIVARALEVIHAIEVALSILEAYVPPKEPRVRFELRSGAGSAATEAPRGLLYHRYEVEADGRIGYAKIVPPTSQNQAQIESDLRQLLPALLAEEDQAIALKCEQLVRSYDPCISCSTHFLKLHIEGRQPAAASPHSPNEPGESGGAVASHRQGGLS